MAKARRKIEKTLRLVSPTMRGPDVRALQWLLSGHDPSVWTPKLRKTPIVTYQGQRDNIFGTATAQACRRAKHWLGYPEGECTPDAGQKLFDYLTGYLPLPPDHKLRRDRRLVESKNPKKYYALKEAQRHIGKGESPPGSNCTEFGRWYGFNCVAWCAIFVSYCANKAGIRFRYASVAMVVDDARWGRNGLSLTKSPVPGDLFVIGGDDHIGFVASVPSRWGNFNTVEGNSGDRVRSGTRNRYRCSHFIRLGAS